MQGRRLSVCFVAPNAYPMLSNSRTTEFVGGAELQQILIARELARRGHEVSMICLDFGQEDRVSIDGITVLKAFKPRAGFPVVRFVWPRLTTMWRCMNDAGTQVYYQRAASALTGIVVGFCKWRGRKSVFAVAGEPMIRFARDKWLYQYGARNADQVIVQSESQQRQIRADFEREAVIIPNACESVVDESREKDIDVLWVSTIRQLKRPDVVLRLAREMPEHRFTIVGGEGIGESALYRDVERQASMLPNVHFAGYVAYADIDVFFDRARVFVNTSDTEGFPNTFLQSWIRGVPTVSFVDSGARSGSETVGLVVTSVSSMREAIGRLLSDERYCRAVGSMAKEYALANHGVAAVADEYERVFLPAAGE